MRILLNGETRDIPAELSLGALLDLFSLPSQRVAVELNKAVIPRADWKHTQITESDEIEVIHFVGGG